MAMDRTERMSVGVAVAAHVLLFIALSLSWRQQADRRFDNPPMTVDIVAEAAPQSSAPVIEPVPPPPAQGEPEEVTPAPPPEPAPRVITPPKPTPPTPQPRARTPERPAPPAVRRPAPAPTPARTPPPRPAPPAAAKPAPADDRPRRRPDHPSTEAARPAPTRTPPARTPPARPAGDPLGDIARSVTRSAPRTNPAATGAPAQRSATEIRRSISTSINAEVARPWNACRVSGIDVDQLRTTIVFRLTQTGALERIVSVRTTGVTDSNRPQLARFEECARRAIDLAAPFNLPAESYSYWQTYTLDFRKE